MNICTTKNDTGGAAERNLLPAKRANLTGKYYLRIPAEVFFGRLTLGNILMRHRSGFGSTVKAAALLWVGLLVCGAAAGQQDFESPPLRGGRFIHKIWVDVRPAYVAPTHNFLRGENYTWTPIDASVSGHLTYAFQFKPNTPSGRIYDSAYQGLGIAGFTFGDSQQLGDPVAVYLLQGARIGLLAPRLSFNYEWNFGLSFGWKPYDEMQNEYNRVIGSRVNAYINANFYLNWVLSRQVDLMAGVTLTHFSNGSTRLPNAGLNTLGLKFGVTYNFNREELRLTRCPALTGAFERHVSYDLTFFGAWRVKGIAVNGDEVKILPKRSVVGFNFSPLYNVGYKFRTGLSLDGVYDGTANAYLNDYGELETPGWRKQLALGVSVRAEYVMPYFTVSFGLGANVIHSGGDLKSFYQVLALKIQMTRSSFLHIGYSLKQFKAPNFLMLGVGYRFNNKTQKYRP